MKAMLMGGGANVQRDPHAAPTPHPTAAALALPPASYTMQSGATLLRNDATPTHATGMEAASRGAIRPLDELETEAIRAALAYYHGNRRNAAHALGISERTLYRKMKEKDLE